MFERIKKVTELNPLDSLIEDARQEVNTSLPDWQTAAMMGDDPIMADLIGVDRAKARKTFAVFNELEEYFKKRKEEVRKLIENQCEHEFVVVSHGDHSSKYDWDREDRYCCEICGMKESGRNVHHLRNGSIPRVVERHEYYQVDDLKHIIEIPSKKSL